MLELRRLASIATKRCHLTHRKLASAATNVRSVPHASNRCWAMFVHTVGAASRQDPSDRQGIGKTTSISARTRRARKYGTGQLTGRLMNYSRPPSELSHLRSGSTASGSVPTLGRMNETCTSSQRALSVTQQEAGRRFLE